MPTSFVVKNGSRILLRFSSGMPQPVSEMRIATWFGSCSFVSMTISPCVSMACAAFVMMLRNTWLICDGEHCDLGDLAVELADGGLVLDDVLRDHQRLVEAGVDVEARDRRAVEAAEILQALRHLRELAQARDAVAREVLDLLDRGVELEVAQA